MKQGRTDRDWAVVALMAFFAGAFLVWALLSKHPPQPRPPLDVDWPAWVQAIGSVVGIAVAIYVPWRQRRLARIDEEQVRKDKVKIMRMALSAAAGQYRGSLAAAFQYLEEAHEVRKRLPKNGIRRPLEFDQFRSELYLLGEQGERVNRLIASHTTMSGSVMAMQTSKGLSPSFMKIARRNFPAMIKLATEVSDELARTTEG
ncbi:hypothetical protein [Stenotrophomonas sp. CASM110]|uniref:hypothetical protein n=1 Tax=Stenotrophomonas sp. CASM110 TaxID=3111510 RepID=UPI003BF8A19E